MEGKEPSKEDDKVQVVTFNELINMKLDMIYSEIITMRDNIEKLQRR